MRISDWSSDVCSSDLAQAGRWRNTRCQLRGIAACPSPFHPRASAEGGVRAGSKRDTGNPQCRSMGRCGHGMRVRFNEVRRVGPQPDDGMARPLWRPWRHDLLACGEARDLRLFRSEEHTFELQSLMRNSYAVFRLKKKRNHTRIRLTYTHRLKS